MSKFKKAPKKVEPFGYMNKVPGNQYTALVEINTVDNLPDDQKQLFAAIASIDRQKKVIQAIFDKQQKEFEKEMEELEKQTPECLHHVFSDEWGPLYSSRTCKICGAYMGLL